MGVFNFLWAFLNMPCGGRGQAMTEYILIIAIIAVGLIVVFVAFGDQLRNLMETVMKNISGEREDDVEQVDTPETGGPFDEYDSD